MLVISPESSCDICLEHFALDGNSRAPHAPRCGHVFCLRCLKSLTRRVCPMCRSPFQPSEVTKIHLDQRARSSSVTNSPTIDAKTRSNPNTKLARELHDRINSFVQTGASTSVAHALTEDCKTFFQENTATDHPDFYVTYQLLNHFLLGYYRAFFQDPAAADKSLNKFQAEVQAYHRSWETKYRRLTKEIEDLTRKLHLETNAREKEALERQEATAAAQSLRDELQAQESWWHWKYEELRVKYAGLQAEASRTRGVQKRTAAESFGPFVEFDKKGSDEVSIDHEDETNPLDLPLTFPKDWDGFVEDQKTSPQPPPYDSVGCLSIISTPMLKDGSLRDETQMKELLSDLLSDPSATGRRRLSASSVGSNPGSSSSAAHRPPTSTNHPPVLSARRSTISSTTPTLPPPQPSCPTEPPSQPNVPLWTGKRSLRTVTHGHNIKGNAAGTVVARSLSASEAE